MLSKLFVTYFLCSKYFCSILTFTLFEKDFFDDIHILSHSFILKVQIFDCDQSKVPHSGIIDCDFCENCINISYYTDLLLIQGVDKHLANFSCLDTTNFSL